MRGYITIRDELGNVLVSQPNQIQDDSKAILAHLLSGDTRYKISKFYIEYCNMNNTTDVVPVASFDVSEGSEYYTNLQPPFNFIREPIVLPIAVTDTSATFSIILANSSGFHDGAEFSETNYSRIFSMALAASPIEQDQPSDLIYSRTNLDEQILKTDNQNLYFTWEIEL